MTMPRGPVRQIEGALFACGGGVLVCRHPLSPALPIPLSLHGPRLLTWAFAGAGDVAPYCVLVLNDADGTLARGGRLTVATHFHDLVVHCAAPRPVAELDGPARTALAGAVLAAVTPETLADLSMLFAPLAPVPAEAPLSESAPRLTLAADTDTQASLTGLDCPNYLLVRAGGTWSCARVAGVEMRFGRPLQTLLTLAPAWGAPQGARPDRALCLGTGTVTPVALAGVGG